MVQHKFRFLLLAFFLISVVAAYGDTVRVATFNVSLARKGPGLLLKDIMSGKDQQVDALVVIIQHTRPDILLLNEFDHDYSGLALKAFLEILAQGDAGITYPHSFAIAGNAGQPSGRDLDNDGRSGEWADAHGFGRFPGNGSMALLSRFPLDLDAARSFAQHNWIPPIAGFGPMRLSSKSHWDVPVILPNAQRLHILASHPTPPVFDGPEDLNGLRNDAEIEFWVSYLDKWPQVDDSGISKPFAGKYFVLLGDLNNDPVDGEGLKAALSALLRHVLVSDPQQRSEGAKRAAIAHAGANLGQLGDPATDTVDWGPKIGNMRVDYALPSANLKISDSGVFWPAPEAPFAVIIGNEREGATNHRMVWVDIEIN